MKNRFSKITLLVLSLVIVLGVAFALSVGAEETVKPEIIGKNILYTDKTAIQIAVNSATVDASDVKLVVTKANGAEVTVTDPVEKIVDDKSALVFTLEGIPASAICENVSIVVKSGDNESDAFTYSVAEYFYERLYSDGIINATEGKKLSQKTLYETYLAHGAAAQDLFLNYDEDGNRVAEPVTLVDKYNVIAINNGVLDNGNEVMISADSFSTTVTANDTLAADKTFTGKWTVTTYGETVTTETVANGATVTANGIIAVTPVYNDATGAYYLAKENNEIKGTIWDFDKDGATVPTSSAAYAGFSQKVTNGSLIFDSIAGSESYVESYVRWNLSSVANLSNPVLVFETDVKFEDFVAATPGKLLLQAKAYKVGAQITVSHSGNYIKLTSGGGEISIEEGKQINLRFEYNINNKTINVFIDNVYEGSLTASVSTNESYDRAIWYMLKNETNGCMTFDNSYIGLVEDGTPIPAN